MDGLISKGKLPLEGPRTSGPTNALLPLAGAMLAVTVLSVFLAVIPHLFVYLQYKNFRFFSNFDDQIYSAIAKTAYFDGWHLREPYTRPQEGVPSLYAPLLFLPYATLTRLLNFSSVDVLGMMRVCGGLLLGITLTWCLYLFLEDIPHRTFWVIVCGSIFLGDAGTLLGRSLISNFLDALYTYRHGWLKLGDFLGQFRVAAILLCLPFLLLLVTSLRNAERVSRRDIFIGIAALSILVYTYFYYWLAAALMLALLIGTEVIKCLAGHKNPANRRVLSLSAILLLGLIIGAPQLYSNAHTFSQPQYKEILARIARGQALLPNDPIRFLHIWNFWALGKLLFGAVVIVALRLWRLRVLWLLGLVGYLLTNLAVFAKIDFENHHWVTVTNPMTELMLLILLAFLAERFLDWRKVRVAAPCLALLIVISGATLRGMGTLRAEWGLERTAALQRVLPLTGKISSLGPDCTIVGTGDDAEAVFQLSSCAMLFSTPYTALITPIPDQEVNERQALCYWLEGWTVDEYRVVAGYPMSWNSFGHPEWQPPFLVKARSEIFEKLGDPAFRRTLIARYRPTHLAINERAGRKPAHDCEWKVVASLNGVTILELLNPD